MAITKTRALKSLLERGYFPKELPPPFQTVTFAKRATRIGRDWSNIVAGMNKDERKKHSWSSVPTRFDLARKGFARRILSIINPVNQYNLAKEIAANYRKIKTFTDRSKWSLTRAEISLTASRAVPLPSFASLPEARLNAYATKGTILSTDIAGFYHSIYTHSIPWALHGKARAKESRFEKSLFNSLFGNKLDTLIRQCQQDQTKGIPVGPDTSRILSEIILVAIDQALDAKSGQTIVGGYRYIDDIFYCFHSSSDADSTLSSLREIVHQFELDLNSSKTSQVPATSFNEETWPYDIRAARIRSGKAQRQSIFSFFSIVIRIAQQHSNESIATYAVKATTKVRILQENWDVYEAFLFRISREHTNTVDLVSKIICTYASLGYPISELAEEWINDLIVTRSPLHHHFEVAWALWTAISLRLKLSAASVLALGKLENGVCALLALHAQDQDLCSAPLDVSVWFNNLTPSSLYDERWLLVYEAIRQGMLDAVPPELASEPFFKVLMKHKVTFYNRAARNRPLDIPMTARMIKIRSGRLRKNLLEGNIFVPKGQAQILVEEVGGDYDEDEFGDSDGDFGDADFEM